jgi:hypothetical protein
MTNDQMTNDKFDSTIDPKLRQHSRRNGRAFSSLAAYSDFLEKFRMSENLIAASPECLRKLVEEALAYAEDLGFSPDPDYHRVKALFGDIDSRACSREFKFGENGNPYYVPGPNDSPRRINAVMKQLSRRRGGPEGFHFTIASPDFIDTISWIPKNNDVRHRED